jgi:hypothetical protein
MPTPAPALSIGKLARLTEVKVPTIRFYEQIGLLRGIGRNTSGHRVFSKKDLDWLDVLRCLPLPVGVIDAAEREGLDASVLAVPGVHWRGGAGPELLTGTHQSFSSRMKFCVSS